MKTANIDFSGLGKSILDEFKAGIGDGWTKLTPEEQTLLETISLDAAELAIRKLGGEDVASEEVQVTAQIKSIRSIGSARAFAAFTLAVRRVARVAIQGLFAAALA